MSEDGKVVYKIVGDDSGLGSDLDRSTDTIKGKTSKWGGIASSALTAIGAAAAAAGTALLAAGAYGVNAATDMDKAMNQLQSSTGVAKDELGAYQDTLESIYANNYGEDFEDIAQKMGMVKQQLGDLNQSDLQLLTEGLYTLEDVFESDFNETLRGTEQLMTQFGLTAEEAMDMMAAGSQAGLDYTQELGDNIAEYSGKFAQAGYSAEEYFQLLKNGSDGGAYNLDKVNDAINEVTTRLADGTIEEALGSFDQDTQKVFKAWQDGEATQKDVIDAIVNNIKTCTNEQEALTLASTAFGTMGEDANRQFIESLTSVGDEFSNVAGKMAEIQEVKYDDLGSQLEGLKRTAELLAVPLGEMLIPVLVQLAEMLSPVLSMLADTLEPTLGSLSETLPGLFDPLVDVLPGLIELMEALLPPVVEIVGKLLPPLVELLESLLPPVTELLENLLPPLLEVLEILLEPLYEILDTILPVLIDLLGVLSPLIEALSPLIKNWASAVAGNLRGAFDVVMPVIEAFWALLKSLIQFITGVFTGNWDLAWEGIVGIFKGWLNLIPTTIESVINNAIEMINRFIRGVNAISDLVGITIPEIPHVTLPRFQTGVDFVMDDWTPAYLDRGERVLTAEENRRYTALGGVDGMVRYISDQWTGAPDPAGGGSYVFELHGDVTMDGFKVGKVVLRNLDDAASFTLRG